MTVDLCGCGSERKQYSNGRIYCPSCISANKRKYYKNNKLEILEKSKDRYANDSETILERNRRYRLENAQTISSRGRRYYEENRDSIIEKARCYREENQDVIRSRKNPLKSVYADMKQRCYNPRHKSFSDYGGRGIIICDRWSGPDGFLRFFEDMGTSYEPGLTIDRYPDRDGNYEPGNVRWATPQEQAANRRVNLDYRKNVSSDVTVMYRDVRQTLTEVSELTGIHLAAIKNRYALYGDSDIISNPPSEYKWLYKNRLYSMVELALIADISYPLMRERIIYLRWSVEKSVETPVNKSKQNKKPQKHSTVDRLTVSGGDDLII